MIKTHEIVCAVCGEGEFGHRRDNGECMKYQHAGTRPYVLSRRVKTPDTHWEVRR